MLNRKANLAFDAVGYVLSFTIGQALVIAVVIYIAYIAGKLG